VILWFLSESGVRRLGAATTKWSDVGGQISSSNLFLGLEPQKWALAWMGRKREEQHRDLPWFGQ
jgi:hypothetical protein